MDSKFSRGEWVQWGEEPFDTPEVVQFIRYTDSSQRYAETYSPGLGYGVGFSSDLSPLA